MRGELWGSEIEINDDSIFCDDDELLLFLNEKIDRFVLYSSSFRHLVRLVLEELGGTVLSPISTTQENVPGRIY